MKDSFNLQPGFYRLVKAIKSTNMISLFLEANGYAITSVSKEIYATETAGVIAPVLALFQPFHASVGNHVKRTANIFLYFFL
ncbi:hypothetical protein SDC9_105656 [bioreactor metagenome]|uniref:Uncharacterized protein n=1 Tax=bioreactor metagenome TaxID=1076179 RepID=A0A645B6Q1_9ZZZZ